MSSLYLAELGKDRRAALADIYLSQPKPREKLPYSSEFDTLFEEFKNTVAPWVPDRRYVWLCLNSMGKLDDVSGHKGYEDPPEDQVNCKVFGRDGVDWLNQIYKYQYCPSDLLPYSRCLDYLVNAIAEINGKTAWSQRRDWPVGHRMVYLTYINMRKQGLLFRMKDGRSNKVISG